MRFFLLVLTCAWAVSAGAKEGLTRTTSNVDKFGVILKGYDAVSYFNSPAPQKGDAQIQTKFEENTYLFANENNKQEFLKNPSKYAPLYGGWCAYAVADSKSKVDVDPTKYLIQDGKLLVFYNGLWGDTRKKWQTDEKAFFKKAETNWPEVKNLAP